MKPLLTAMPGLQRQARRIDALTLRERAIMFVSLAVALLAGGMFPGWALLLAPVFETLLWPLVTTLLLVPQRRAPDRDQNRPL